MSGLAGPWQRWTAGTVRVHWLGPLVLFGTQAALLLVYWFICWLTAMIVHRPTNEQDPDLRYLWWLSAPMFGVFLAFSFKTGGGEVNWPVTAYLSGMVLAGAWLGRASAVAAAAGIRRMTYAFSSLTCTVGLSLTFLMHRTRLPVSAAGETDRRADARTLRTRCASWTRVAGCAAGRTWPPTVDSPARTAFEQEGVEPVLAGCTGTCPASWASTATAIRRPTPSACRIGDRHSQYDLWHNPIDNVAAFKGRTFLIVGGKSPGLCAAFEHVEDASRVIHRVHGNPISEWTLLIGRGYKGIAPPAGARH